MSAAYTPGPWRVSPNSPTIILKDNRPISHDGISIGSASGYTNSGFFPSYEEAIANARLMAVAPELLDALQWAIKFIDIYAAKAAGPATPELNRARAAIAKVLGAQA